MSCLFQILNDNFSSDKKNEDMHKAAREKKQSTVHKGGRGKRNPSNLDAYLLSVSIRDQRGTNIKESITLACRKFPDAAHSTIYINRKQYHQILVERGVL